MAVVVVVVVADGEAVVVVVWEEEGTGFRGDRSRLIREAVPAPRKEERGLLVLTLGSGVCGRLLGVLVLLLCFVDVVVLVEAARSRESSSS